ncbi:MAG: hypothetical protein FGM32_02420 [Candidatus Kapabacteria bacterium]|nr:hypothetical protein [Candidatus Kapabacteria bacterium]
MKHAFLWALVAVFAVSCSKDEPTSPEPSGPRRLTVGSSFTYEGYQLDAAGIKKAGTDFEAIYTVIDSNLSYAGKTGVWALRTTGPTGADTVYQCIDANNDLLQFTEIGNENKVSFWVRFPVSTTAESKDSTTATQTVNGVPINIQYVWTVERQGDSPILVGTESVTATSMVLRLVVKATAFGQTVLNVTISQSAAFAPKIGAFVLQSGNEQTINAGNVVPGFYQKMKAYTLK